MLLIECPHCGPRDETEFHYGGQAHVPYPEDPSALNDREWAEYLFYRENTRGVLAERWLHGAGCRKWFNALRNTVTYDFLTTYPAGTPRPPVSDDAGAPPAPAAPAARDKAGDAASSDITDNTAKEGNR